MEFERDAEFHSIRNGLVKEVETNTENFYQSTKYKNENIKEMTHNIYVILCILIIFISLYFLNNNRFLLSTLIVLGISLLHFKSQILELLNQMIEIKKLI